MVRVALVSSPLTAVERYGRFAGAGSSQPSLALVCLGAVALREGAEVLVLDASAEGLSVETALKEILDFSPDILGISSTTAGIVASGELALRMKQANPRTITVIGGPHVTAIPGETLDEFPGFDAAVIGEGEITFRELIASVRDRGSIPVVHGDEILAGTALRYNGQVRLNPSRPLLRNLDELPLPAWRLLRGFPEAYRPSPMRIRRFPCAPVVFTRGCPNRCTFCDRSVFGDRIRSFSPSYGIAMIRDLRDNFGVRELLIEDDTFIVSKRRVHAFCEELIAQKIDISWSCLGRADRVTPDLLQRMKKAGCWHISFGIESGDPRILEQVGKGESLDHIADAVRWSHEAGLKTKGFFMVGFPGETGQSLRLTRELALKLPLDDISVMQLTPFPGTELYEHADSYGTFDRDWRKMNILTTVFVPCGFTKKDMERARASMLRSFYFRPAVLARKFFETALHPRRFMFMFKGFLALLKVIMKRGNDG